MVKHGASGKLVLKMIANTVLDLIVGGIPVVGTVADFVIRSNDRNIALYKEFVEDGKHQGSAKWVLFALLILAFLLIGLVVGLLYWLATLFIGLF